MFVMRSSSDCVWERAVVTFWAASGSSHRSGADALSESSAIWTRSASGLLTALMVPSVERRARISCGKSMVATIV
ncbi:hypothetical protein D3C74_438040 [compost metagenome]